MVAYSHSRLGTYQQCKYKYKLQYIDKVKVDVPDTVETYMGKLVHEALEKLYKDLGFQKVNTKQNLIDFYLMRWEEDWKDTILIAKKEYTQDNYKDMGKKFIGDYYDHYKPFNHLRTIGLETEDRMQLEDGNQYHVRIDRLSCDKEGNYYVCDYKTNNRLKAQGELDEDRQLAMYSLWVKNNFADCKSVKLVWYFLAFDKELVSERSEEQLLELKKSTEDLIAEIEVNVDWPTNVTALCGWCKFKPICPAWKHEYELEEKTPEEFAEDDGVKLVDELAVLEAQKKEATVKVSEIKEKLIVFAKQKEVQAVFGTENKVSVKSYESLEYPKTEEFYSLLKSKGLWDSVTGINGAKMQGVLKKADIDITKLLVKELKYRLSLSKRK
ncbi:PD-(D/E)XK nuclease family protein [archaeon]|nr:PD-(D/E)XK nuclease family protein [archaeon]